MFGSIAAYSLNTISIPKSVKHIGENAFSERYTVQPDRRYNPWTEYQNLPIIIECHSGSYAQKYARASEFELKQAKTIDKKHITNTPVYSVSLLPQNCKLQNDSIEFFSGFFDKSEKWVKVNSETIIVQSNDTEIAEDALTENEDDGIRFEKI